MTLVVIDSSYLLANKLEWLSLSICTTTLVTHFIYYNTTLSNTPYLLHFNFEWLNIFIILQFWVTRHICYLINLSYSHYLLQQFTIQNVFWSFLSHHISIIQQIRVTCPKFGWFPHLLHYVLEWLNLFDFFSPCVTHNAYYSIMLNDNIL